MEARNVKTRFEPRIRDLLGSFGDVEETSDDEYQWTVFMPREGYILDFTITERKVREDGSEGFAFMLKLTTDDGRVLESFAPMNYTPACWTRSWEELERRFASIEQFADEITPMYGKPR